MARSLAYNPAYALNAICPYFTMFPLEYPLGILQKHVKHKPVILDPFCGRGTSIFAARKMGLSSWGIDTSPIAVSIARAKLASANIEEILSIAEELLKKEPIHIPTTEFFRAAFSIQTLSEICSLREGLLNLNRETDASILLRAATLGCLHGPLNKTVGYSSYFSNQMPRTFSSKPAYSVQYWKKRGMIPNNVKVLDVLRRKLSRIPDLNSVSYGKPEQILCADSRSIHAHKMLPNNISSVITSPPYYGMQTYVQDQWLRMWFLGGPETVDYINDKQLDHNGLDIFIQDLATVWQNISISQSDHLDLYIRFGTVPSIKSDARKIIKSSLEVSGGWKLVSVRNAKNAHAGKRQANQMATKSLASDEYDFHAIRI